MGIDYRYSAPDLETRIAILRKKADMEGIDAPADVLAYIANHVQSNIRELEGAFVRVVAYANLNRAPISQEIAVEALKNIIGTQNKIDYYRTDSAGGG